MLSFPLTESRDNTFQGGRLGMCFNDTTPFGDCDVKTPTTPTPETTNSQTSPTFSPDDSGFAFTVPVIAGMAATVVFILVAIVTFIMILCLCAKGRKCVVPSPIKRRASFHDNPNYSSPGEPAVAYS